MQLYSSPFSRGYWRDAAAEVKNLRKLVFAALMIAAAIALGFISIPISVNLKVGISFIARALAAWVCGPVLGLMYGFAEDIVGWFINGGGPFFPGYTLDTMLAVLVYALCFYRQNLTIWRVILAKIITNYPISVGLGCLWSQILYGKGYLYYAAKSLVKNTAYLPIQIILLIVVFQAVTPALRRMRMIPTQTPSLIRWKRKQ